MTEEENNNNSNNSSRYISKEEILDELEKLTEAVIDLSERIRLLLENLGFLVV